MPSIVHRSPSFAARGFAIVSHSAVEQVNGLIEVQCRYVTTANRAADFSSKFYPDAPPPLHPPCVQTADLITGRLYMRNRQISQANGLVTVDAEYVGGFIRQGGAYRISFDREIITKFLYRIEVLQQTFEYVEIGNIATAPSIKVPIKENLTKIIGRLSFVIEDDYFDYIKWLKSEVLVLEKPIYLTNNVKIIQKTFYIE